MTGNLNFGDNDKAVFGAGSDLQIYHDGNNSFITEQGTGSLYLSGTNLFMRTTANELYLSALENSGVTLYHDNSGKLATTSYGIDVGGKITADGIDLGDSQKATFGASDDLQIYHDGSNSYIRDNGTGGLVLEGSSLLELKSRSGEVYFRGTENGAVQLRYDNAEKLATTSTGVDVYGNVTLSGTVDGRDVAADGSKLDGIATGANNYSHPTYAGDDFSIDTGALSGATVISDIDINVTTDGLGHVTDANASVATRTLTLANLGYTGATNANYYTHPSYAGDDINLDTGALSGATVISDLDFNITTDTLGHVTDANATVATRNLTAANIGAQPAGTYNTVIGTDSDINTSGATIIDNLYMTDGVITSHGTRTLTLGDLGAGSLASLSAVGAAQINDNSVSAAELNVSGNGTTAQYLRADGDGSFTWATPPDTNTTYSAGAGLDLSGTTFRIEPDLRDGIDYIGKDSGDYLQFVVNSYHRHVVNGAERMRIESDGDLHADGDVIAYSTTISDERLKEDIVGIDGALDKVNSLSGYTFKYKADGKVSAGVIAQEVEAVMPEAVTEKLLPLKADDGQEYKVVNYDALHGLLIEAVKELTKRVEELEAK
jgi:hypothetical protein